MQEDTSESKEHFRREKALYSSKKIFAYLLSILSFHVMVTGTDDWKVVAVKASFLIVMYLIFAVAKSVKDVIAIMKQVDAIIEINKGDKKP